MKTALLAFASLVLACTAQASGDLYYVQIDTNPPYIWENQIYDHNPTEVTDYLLAQSATVLLNQWNQPFYQPYYFPFHVVGPYNNDSHGEGSATPEPAFAGGVALLLIAFGIKKLRA